MAATAGQVAEADRIPGERIATTTETSSSGTITTTETSVSSVTGSLVTGRTYRIIADVGYSQSVATDTFTCRIREGTTGGSQLQRRTLAAGTTAGFMPGHIETEYTATSTGDETFHLTLERATGTGNISTSAASSAPTLLYVEYVEG